MAVRVATQRAAAGRGLLKGLHCAPLAARNAVRRRAGTTRRNGLYRVCSVGFSENYYALHADNFESRKND